MWRTLRAVGRKRLFSYVLMLVGVALLLYVGTQYGTMFAEQRRMRQEFERQQQPKQAPDLRAAPVKRDGLTRISIPKINLEAMMVEGTSHRQLLVGLGHVKETPIPGESGNAVVTAHRDTFFRHIHELSKGDEVLVERDGHVYRYEVTGKKIVPPNDLSVLRQGADKRLTLITCYPTYYIGPAPERLVIFSKFKEEAAAGQSTSGVAKAVPARAEVEN